MLTKAEIKERPIPFRTPMVRAILDGRRTQTRRIVKEPTQTYLKNASGTAVVQDGVAYNYSFEEELGKCPYGKPGDRLWVRETVWLPEGTKNQHGHVTYQADHGPDKALKWTQSRFMPHWASRILLEITDIRVERLQDISEDDAKAEGVIRSQHGNEDQWVDYPLGSSAAGWTDPRDSYRSLWQSINGPDSWNANPFVWVIAFRRVKPCA